ncbi:AAA-like domain-containing protein [Gloeothece verrucosa]|uniref:WD40 repeat, subgroup n=1 Tax=Gloeothece verrucosa (strain PCC 7822) TaxID=497965 RepID=E0U7W3_GLOV7|nr:AAA-like domain-containing protein [Gloeothece verrucosa]ADN16050.1 WD40 repeat, subgroup [Gloeothece verrucosa PCC 7822]
MRYQVGGSLRCDDPTYVVRSSDEQLYTALKAGDFCYVLNSRQMGKSSLLQRTSDRLEKEGYRCAYLDITRLGSEETTPIQWYKGIIISLFYSLNLAEQINFKDWWAQQTELSPVQRLHQFVEHLLLPGVNSERIFIFIDEIDSLLSLKFSVNDFFAWIRHCYNLRAQNPNFKRLSFALFGVASPSDLIADKRRTPFNIGKAIELYGFQPHETYSLLQGLQGVVSQPQVVLQKIIHWSGGQPFLTQKICSLVVQAALEAKDGSIILPRGTEDFWVEQLVQERIIQHWESQDEPEHLRTIRDRILFNEAKAGRLLGLYQRILQAEVGVSLDLKNNLHELSSAYLSVVADDSKEQSDLLLSGLVEKHKGYLRIKNPIYRLVFNSEWVTKQLDNLRPYSQTFNAWVASNFQDESRLLRGQALIDAQNWSQGKSLSDLDYQFLAASQQWQQRQIQMALEAARAQEAEYRLAQEKKTAKFQRLILIAVGIGLIVSSALSLVIFQLYSQTLKSEQQARVSEIKALVSSSEGLFASNRRLDALIEAIKAKERLQKLGSVSPKLDSQVTHVLRDAIYGADEYNRFWGHKAAVLAVAVSPDSSIIASASVDQTVKLWGRDGTLYASLSGHHAIVRAVNFSPDGQLLVSGDDNGKMLLWKRNPDRTYHLFKTIQAHQGGIWGIAWSGDGKTIASASFDKTVKLWKRDCSLVITFAGYRSPFWGVAFSPDNQIVAAASLDRTVKLWKRDSTGWQAKPLQTLSGHNGWVAGVAFSPDSKMLASSSEDKTVKLWQRDDTDKTYHLLKTLSGHTAGIWGVAFSPDRRTLASASLDKTIKLWSIDGTELRTLRGHSTSVWGVTWSPDGSFIASAGTENLVKLWQSENPFQKTMVAHQAGTWSVAISPDSSMIVTLSHENTTKLWSRSGQLLKTFPSLRATISGISFTEESRVIAFADEDNTVYFWQPDGTSAATYQDPNKNLLTVALSPDQKTLATAYLNRTIQLRQGNFSRSKPKILRGHQAEIWQLKFSPDSRLLASASSDGTAKLWTREGKLFRTLAGHTSAVWGVAFSRDGQMIATGSGDNRVKLWNLEGKLLKTFIGHQAAVWGVDFSPDGKIIASGSVDTTIKLWKPDGTELTTLSGHTAAVRAIAISPDGAFLASVGDDNSLILWNLPRILHLEPLRAACHLVQDYLKTNLTLEPSERAICHQ